jgi:deazaflavin-dependent oxidoreductase (nitroreductase family)
VNAAFSEANGFQRAMRRFAGSSVGSKLFAHTLHHLDRGVSRLTKGRRTFAGIVSGLPTVFLTTTGAKSGQPRTVPVLGVPYGEGIGVIASNFGQAKHPAWFHNLKANPEASLSVNGEPHDVLARLATPEERAAIWEAGLEIYPAWKKYEARAGDRHIEAFVLDPR